MTDQWMVTHILHGTQNGIHVGMQWTVPLNPTQQSVCVIRVIKLDGLTHPTQNSRIRWTTDTLRHSRKTRISVHVASNQENITNNQAGNGGLKHESTMNGDTYPTQKDTHGKQNGIHMGMQWTVALNPTYSRGQNKVYVLFLRILLFLCKNDC